VLTFAQGGPPTTSTLMDGNWSNTGIWSNGIPTSNKSATINHNVTIDVNSITKNLTINSTLTNSGYLLEFVNFTNSGTYTDNGGTNEIRQNGTVSGNDTYFYNFSSKGGKIQNVVYIKNLLNLPTGVFNVSGGTLTLLNDGTNDGRLGISTGSISGNFVWQKYLDRCYGWSMLSFPGTATLSSVVGYPTWTAYYDETNTGTMNYGWNYYGATDAVNQGDGVMTYDVTYTRIISLSVGLSPNFTYTIDYTSTGVPTDDGWNIVGNPHPGTIDWDAGGWTKTNVSGSIYTWSSCSSSYGSYVSGVGTNGMDQYIPSGESFWIQTTAATPALTCPKSTIVDDSNGMMRKKDPLVFRMEFNGDETVVVVRGTDGFDYESDAIKFDGGYIYTEMEDVKYSINSIGNNTKTIPLWTNGSGDMLLTNVLPNNWNVYILDKTFNEVTKITDNSSFYIYGTNGYENRYDLIFKNNNGKPIFANGNKLMPNHIDPNIYDMYGKIVTGDITNKTGLYIQYDAETGTYKKIPRLSRR
jgi:hypothetical protein